MQHLHYPFRTIVSSFIGSKVWGVEMVENQGGLSWECGICGDFGAMITWVLQCHLSFTHSFIHSLSTYYVIETIIDVGD